MTNISQNISDVANATKASADAVAASTKTAEANTRANIADAQDDDFKEAKAEFDKAIAESKEWFYGQKKEWYTDYKPTIKSKFKNLKQTVAGWFQ